MGASGVWPSTLAQLLESRDAQEAVPGATGRTAGAAQQANAQQNGKLSWQSREPGLLSPGPALSLTGSGSLGGCHNFFTLVSRRVELS